MVEPVTFVTATLVSAALGEALHRGIDALIRKPDIIGYCTTVIESKLDALIEGPVRSAHLALKRGDVSRAIERMEDGIGNDPLNAHAWVIYATLLSTQGNPIAKKRATEIFADVIHTFGLGCPALPQEIRDAYAPFDGIQIPSASPINKTVYALDDWLHSKDVAVSRAGIAAGFFKRNALHFLTEGIETRVYFQPWILPAGTSSYSTCEQVVRSGDSTSGGIPTLIRAMTDKYVVLDSSVWEIATGKSTYLGSAKIDAAFGTGKYGYSSSNGTIRGVTVHFHEDVTKHTYGSGFLGQSTVEHIKCKVLASAPVIPPQQLTHAR